MPGRASPVLVECAIPPPLALGALSPPPPQRGSQVTYWRLGPCCLGFFLSAPPHSIPSLKQVD